MRRDFFNRLGVVVIGRIDVYKRQVPPPSGETEKPRTVRRRFGAREDAEREPPFRQKKETAVCQEGRALPEMARRRRTEDLPVSGDRLCASFSACALFKQRFKVNLPCCPAGVDVQIVRRHQHRAVKLRKRVDQAFDRIRVKMVRCV